MEFKKTSDNDRSRKCPVCGFQTMPSNISKHEICDVCWWEDDEVQNSDPDFWGGANDESLNEYRAKWLKEHRRDGLDRGSC